MKENSNMKRDENVGKFCHECGQAIQWYNLEGAEDENT